jgi:squalene-hopene/tetraprenyl-beta-curcumene cyclase
MSREWFDLSAAPIFRQTGSAQFRRPASRYCDSLAGTRSSLYCACPMNLAVDVERLSLAHKAVRAELMSERAADGHWPGHIGSSPFATAAAVSALVVAHHRDSQHALKETDKGDGQAIEQVVQSDLSELLLESVHWLARQQNPDGGWSDCEGARSNIAATMMVQAAFRLTGIPARYADLMVRADDYVEREGGLAALRRHCDGDKTLLAAIMANCALAGMVSWRQVPTLQLELACLPAYWRRNIHVLVPRYVRPIVLAVGRAKFHHDPPKNPILRLWRQSIWRKSLTLLEPLQAKDDSFLASVPLTAFVVMSLGSVGCQEHSIVERGIEFLLSSVRANSSWPNTPNRAVSNSALALHSLATEPQQETHISSTHDDSPRNFAASGTTWNDTARASDTVTEHSFADNPGRPHHHHDDHVSHDTNGALTESTLNWLLKCQRNDPNPLTEVSAGGWASSDAPGALANTSATASVLLALIRSRGHATDSQREQIERAAGHAVVWLLDLQNEDGGWATFYRDDALLRSDESGADVTAQALVALAAWRRDWRTDTSAEAKRRWSFIDERAASAIENGWKNLESHQQADGSFIPLWFGNENQPDGKNPVYGTAQALFAAVELDRSESDLSQRAVRWLVAAQHMNGGWGPPRVPVDYSGSVKDGKRAWRGNEAMAKLCTVEETSLAINALIPFANSNSTAALAVSRGLTWLTAAIEQDAHRRPAIIGFSLAKLWYHERLYPLAFAAGALSRAERTIAVATPAASHVG